MPEPAPIIRIDGVTKRFGRSTVAVDDVSLDIAEGEFFALLGPSGCGKTTLLRMLAGFETLTEGHITIDGQDMADVPPNRRPVNMVFQSYAVFPHMSVHDNVTYGLRVAGVAKAERDQRASEALALVQLADFASRRPDQLSGGQRQRVALARALVKRPRVLLLDEPLSALDAKLRESMQFELVQLQQRVGITFVVVTHDQDEALSMANRIAVMEAGAVRQLATPSALYEHPNSRFVADFIGKINLFDAEVLGCEAGQVRCHVDGLGEVHASAGETSAKLDDGTAVSIAVRPEKLRLGDMPPGANECGAQATVAGVAYHGAESLVFLDLENGARMTASLANVARERLAPDAGTRVWVHWHPADTLVLDR